MSGTDCSQGVAAIRRAAKPLAGVPAVRANIVVRQNDKNLYQVILNPRPEVRQFTRSFAMMSVSLIPNVDDGGSIRESLKGLLKSVGFRVEAFALARDFLSSKALSESRRAYAVHEQSRTSEEVDREPAVDPRHFRYGAWRRGGPGRSPSRALVDDDPGLPRIRGICGRDLWSRWRGRTSGCQADDVALSNRRIGLRRQEKPGSANGTGSEPSDGNPFAEM